MKMPRRFLLPMLFLALALGPACGGGSSSEPMDAADLPDAADPSGDAPGEGVPDSPPAEDLPGDSGPSVDDLLQQGITALGQYAPDLARDFFLAGIEAAPTDPRPRYGLVLAEVQKGWQLLDLLVAELAPPNEATDEKPPRGAAVLSPRQDLAAFLEEVAFGLTDIGARQIDRIGELLDLPGDLVLVVPSLPLRLGTVDFLDLRGEWDRADLHLIRAGQQLLSSLFLFLRAHDLDANLLGAIDIANLDLSRLLGSLPELLARYPTFLGLRPAGGTHPGSGAEDWALLATWLRRAGEDGRIARELMEAEEDDQSDDVFSIGPEVDREEGRVTSTRVRVAGARGDGGAVVLWDGPRLSVRRFFEAFEKGAGGDPTFRLSLSDHVIPVVATMADVVRQAAGLGNVATLFAGAGGLGDLSSIVESLDDLDPETPESVPVLLSDLLAGLLLPKGVLEFDLAAALSRPLPLREVLPAVTPGEPWGWQRRFDCPIFGGLAAVPDPLAGHGVGLLDPDGEWREAPGLPRACFRTRAPDGSLRDQECADLLPTSPDRYEASLPHVFVADQASVTPGNGTLDLLGEDGEVVEAAFLDARCDPPVEVKVAWAGGSTDRLLDAFVACWDGPTCDRPHVFPGATLVADPPGDPTTRPFPDLPADGWASPFPILAWRSPAWNGALWSDLHALKDVKGAPPPGVLGEPGARRLDPATAAIFFPLFARALGL